MSDAALVYRRGVEAFNANDLASARSHFEAATLAAPNAWEPLLSLAHVNVRAGEVFAAAESMNAAVARLSASAAERATMDVQRTFALRQVHCMTFPGRHPRQCHWKNHQQQQRRLRSTSQLTLAARALATRMHANCSALPSRRPLLLTPRLLPC